MTYQGQMIYSTELGHSLAFYNYRQQVKGLTRFLQVSFGILAVVVLIRGTSGFTFTDFVIWIIFTTVIIIFLESVIRRLEKTNLEEEGESLLQIFEYGIIIPRDLTDGENDLYLTYNQILKIEIDADQILLTADEIYIIPYYFIADDEIDVLIGVFEKIVVKVSSLENRDYPTIIPRAYFKDVLH